MTTQRLRFRRIVNPFRLCMCWVLLLLFTGLTHAATPTVYVVPISGTVDPGMAAFIERALRDVSAAGPDFLFVLEIDTFGGRVDSALQIVDTLLTVPPEKSIAYVKTKAISAGALIALACGRLAMRANTTLGDVAPIIYSQEGPTELGEKFQSPLRAKFRALALRNGYPEALAEAMVTAEMAVVAVEMDGQTVYMEAQAFEELTAAEKERVTAKRTVVPAGELLTMNDNEAREFGFSAMSVSGVEEMLQGMAVGPYELVRIEESWSESLVRFIGGIAPYLLMIGLAALYMEMKAPGFGVPGIIGIACLTLVFLNQYIVGLADYTELLLLGLGVILLGFEVFVLPGFGIAGFTGFLFIAVGAVLAFQDFVIPDPTLPWQGALLVRNLGQVLGAMIFSVFAVLIMLRFLLPKLSIGREGPYLAATLKDSHADSKEVSFVKVGDRGVAVTFLRPSGKMQIYDTVADVVTDGEFLPKGTPLIISAIKGNRIIVTRMDGDG